jgi:hypothetical protein
MDARSQRSATQTDADFNAESRSLVEMWRAETGASSLVQQQIQHPAYQRISGMGERALPLILQELQQRPDHWFWALHVISGEQPPPRGATFAEATAAWLAWGRSRGLVD